MVLQLFSLSPSDFEATLIEVFGLEMGKYQPLVSIEKMRGLAYTFPIHLVTPFLYKTGLAPCELLTSSLHFLTSLLSLCPEVFCLGGPTCGRAWTAWEGPQAACSLLLVCGGNRAFLVVEGEGSC